MLRPLFLSVLALALACGCARQSDARQPDRPRAYSSLPGLVSASGWEAPKQLTFSRGDLWYGSASATTPGKEVDRVHGQGTVYWARSTDEGATWTHEVTLGSGTTYLDDPVRVRDGKVVVVAMNNLHNITDFVGSRSVGDVYVRMSDDDGATWGAWQRLTTGAAAFRDSVDISGNDVHLAWMDYRSGNTWDIYYRHSGDGGSTWDPAVKLVSGTNKVGAERPSVTASGSTVVIGWMDARNDRQPCRIEGGFMLAICTDTYVKRSVDGGATWGPDTMVSDGVLYGGRPSLASDGQVFFAAYDTATATNTSESGTVSTDGGATWTPMGVISGGVDGDSTHSSAVVVGQSLALAWFVDSPTPHVYFNQSDDLGASWAGPAKIDIGDTPSLCVTDDYLVVHYASRKAGARNFWESRAPRVAF